MNKKLERPIYISLTLGSVFKVILAAVLFYFMFLLRNLLLVLLTATILATAIEPITKLLIRKKIPRVFSVIIIYLTIISSLAAISYVFIPPLINDTASIVRTIPEYVTELSQSDRFTQFPALSNFVEEITSFENSKDWTNLVGGHSDGTTAGIVTTFSGLSGGLLSALLIIVFSFYLAVQEDGVSNLIRLIIPVQHEKYAIDLWKRSQRKIGLWMQGQLLLSVIIGVLTYLGLSILGINNALFLAILAGIFELIPVFGPIISAIPAIAFGLMQGGVSLALIVTGMYTVIQQFESQLIHPLVVKKIVGIPALLAIIALIVGARIAGFLGIIISVPVTAAIMEYISDIEKNKLQQHKEANL